MRLMLFLLALSGAIVTAGCNRQQKAASGLREVQLSVTDSGFEPAQVEVPRGQPFTLVVTRKSDQTCATEMVFEGGGGSYDLPLGKPVRIDLPAVSDTLRYACGMDMIRGMLVAK